MHVVYFSLSCVLSEKYTRPNLHKIGKLIFCKNTAHELLASSSRAIREQLGSWVVTNF